MLKNEADAHWLTLFVWYGSHSGEKFVS